MNETKLDQLVGLIRSGQSPDLAASLAQEFADWKRNVAKQEAQALQSAFVACATIEEVQSLCALEIAGKSPETVARINELARARAGQIAIGG